MLSSNEIRSIEFEKCMRGYRPEQVQETLDKIAAQLEQMQKEKDEMEKKLYILAGKVEEYRSEEDMLKTAMINAQRMGESVIKEARQKADHIIREADLKASLIDEKAIEKLQSEEERFLSLQEKVAEFKAEVLSIYKNHIEALSDLPVEDDLFTKSEKYSEVKDADFSNVIESNAEKLAEPVIASFAYEEEIVDETVDEIKYNEEIFKNDFLPTEANEEIISKKQDNEPIINSSLGLNGVDYDRINLDEEDVKVFNPENQIVDNTEKQSNDDIIDMPPLKKSVFDIFGDNN